MEQRLAHDAFRVEELDEPTLPHWAPYTFSLMALADTGGDARVASVGLKGKRIACYYYEEAGRQVIFRVMPRRFRRRTRDVLAPGEGPIWTIRRPFRGRPTWRALDSGGRTLAEAREPGTETLVRRGAGLLIDVVLSVLTLGLASPSGPSAPSRLPILADGGEVGAIDYPLITIDRGAKRFDTRLAVALAFVVWSDLDILRGRL